MEKTSTAIPFPLIPEGGVRADGMDKSSPDESMVDRPGREQA
jgi:hypothetical protein